LAQPEPKEKNLFVQAMYRYAKAAAYAGRRKTREALAEQERLEAIAKRIPESETLMINSARAVVSLASEELAARISRSKGDKTSEIAHLQRAVELQDALFYMEPPEWHYTTRTTLGGALLRDGKPAEAEAVFRKDLELNPRSGRSLFGLSKALEMQSKPVHKEWVEKEFKEAWKNSQLGLTIDTL
jgi:tetratricopeptide (TPR) repeat protein